MRSALETGYLNAGSASKLAGRLNFATQHLFRRLGRAMIRPIYAQTCSTTGRISARLKEALVWWLQILELDITECRPLASEREQKICRLFVDAASTPAHCAAVLCIDGDVIYTNAAPSSTMIDQLMERRDKQITSLVLHKMFFVFVMYLCASHCLRGDVEHLPCLDHFYQRVG